MKYRDQKIAVITVQMNELTRNGSDNLTPAQLHDYYKLKDRRDLLQRSIIVDDVEVGEVVAEMHCHMVNFGKFKDWRVERRFEIGEEVFASIVNKLPSPEGYIPKAVGDKFARIVSIQEDFGEDNVIISVLAIYSYDSTYHMATLVKS